MLPTVTGASVTGMGGGGAGSGPLRRQAGHPFIAFRKTSGHIAVVT